MAAQIVTTMKQGAEIYSNFARQLCVLNFGFTPMRDALNIVLYKFISTKKDKYLELKNE